MKTLLLLLSLLTIQSVFAEDYYCTKWSRQSSITCVHGGRNASVWQRQCENPCTWNNMGPHCDMVRVCLNEDPNELSTACSSWVKESSVTCVNPATSRWEQKWVRACQNGLVTVWCSDEEPNQ